MRTDGWPAPAAVRSLDATVELPGSKSMTNRALVLAACADGDSVLRRPLRSRDTELMVDGLRALGVTVQDEPHGPASGGAWRVRPGTPDRARATIDTGNAGTVLRFLPPLAALTDTVVRFDGDEAAHRRPVGELLATLRDLGVHVRDNADGTQPRTLPFSVRGTGRVPGGAARIDASASSQLVSGLLLVAPRYERGVELHHEGSALPSAPHIAMTVRMLRDAGIDVDTTTPHRWWVAAGTPRPRALDIEPDLSNAAPFLAAALVTGGRMRIPEWPATTSQPGDALRDLLTALGADVTLDPGGLTVRGGGSVHGIDVDLRDVSELAPTLAAVAATADSPSLLRGIGHMRGHETDRLDALTRELTGLGCEVQQRADELEIRPRPLRPGVFHSYDDHRMATAGAVLGLVVPGIRVDNIATTGKTLPGFTELWHRMLGPAETATRTEVDAS